MFDGTDMGNICRPGMPGNLPIQWEDKISLENIGLLKRNFTLCRDAMNLDDEEVMTGEVADYKESGGDSLCLPVSYTHLNQFDGVYGAMVFNLIGTVDLIGEYLFCIEGDHTAACFTGRTV